MTDTAREEYDQQRQRGKVYSNGDEARPIDDVSDPHTREDESGRSLRDWAADHKLGIILWSGVLLVGIGILLHWIARYAPGLWRNELLREVLLAGLIFTVGLFLGLRRFLSILRETAWFVEILPKGIRVWMGDYHRDREAFTPKRGFGYFGSAKGAYVVEDMGSQFAEFQAKNDPSDEVTIRLAGEHVRSADTWIGTVVGGLSRGLDPDPQARDGHLVMQRPEEGHEAVLEELIEAIHALEREGRAQLDKISDLREERNYWRERATDREEEIIERHTEYMKDVGEAFAPRRRNRGEDDEPSSTPAQQRDTNELIEALGNSDD